jgi:hypothetical protein
MQKKLSCFVCTRHLEYVGLEACFIGRPLIGEAKYMQVEQFEAQGSNPKLSRIQKMSKT